MKKMLVLAALTTSVTAFAEIKLMTRIDYTMTGKYDDATDNGNPAGQTQVFSAPFNRIMASGKAGGNTEVKLGLNLLGSSATGSAAAYTLYQFVDHFYLQKPFGENCYVRAGRLVNPGGGFEYDTINNGDQYRPTLANSGPTASGMTSPLAPNIATLAVTYPTVIANPGGLAAGYKIGDDHTVELMLTNESNIPQGTGVRKEQNKGLNYHGMFADKMVEVKAGYIMGRADTTTAAVRTEIEQDMLNVGVKLNVNKIGFTAEHFNLKQETKAATSTTDKTSTIYGMIDYSMDKFKPAFKYETSEVEIAEDAATAGSFKRTAMTLVLEFTPDSAEDIRYHVAYSQIEDKYGAAVGSIATYTNEKLETNQFIAGVKFSADFLK